jgi:hypothetical protein
VARDADGNNLAYARSDEAAAWCMFGALRAAGMTGDFHHPAFVRLTGVLDAGMSISSFNDAQESVEPVLAAFDRAIAGKCSGSIRRPHSLSVRVVSLSAVGVAAPSPQIAKVGVLNRPTKMQFGGVREQQWMPQQARLSVETIPLFDDWPRR